LYVPAAQPVKRRRSPSRASPSPAMAGNRQVGSPPLHRRPAPRPMVYFPGRSPAGRRICPPAARPWPGACCCRCPTCACAAPSVPRILAA